MVKLIFFEWKIVIDSYYSIAKTKWICQSK